ncbi:hypothetical protein N7462_009554 [Penicillium macrosclerotiorum]|uniref:uncharacterized protein n=1 Tax=Penicillium macrosclerotiorum TaxID=303699 RepID=UPI00254715FF|nr:uncharacterized protein N7462_009554 [Penicillium macrosclerotiorum]KAJ5674115.1 hypothetical protein N7462_009554 [Penicillium macrosclerotiorum]
MSKCLHACRNHQTSFTSLLHTLIKVTLATEFYPDAKFNHSQLALDVRPYIKPHNRKHVMSCSVSIISSFDWLSQFRRAGKQTSTSGDTLDDADLLWELARKHRAYVLNDIHHKQSWKTAWLSIQLIGEDEEDYAKDFIRGLKLAQPNCFSISNLGAYDASQSASQAVHNGPWSITNMEFSAGAWKSGFGANLNFNVAGVRNGSTIIHANHEVVDHEMFLIEFGEAE